MVNAAQWTGILSHAWNPKQPFINGCFNWMIPNLYIGNGCFTKHLFINGCLGFQVFITLFGWVSSPIAFSYHLKNHDRKIELPVGQLSAFSSRGFSNGIQTPHAAIFGPPGSSHFGSLYVSQRDVPKKHRRASGGPTQKCASLVDGTPKVFLSTLQPFGWFVGFTMVYCQLLVISPCLTLYTKKSLRILLPWVWTGGVENHSREWLVGVAMSSISAGFSVGWLSRWWFHIFFISPPTWQNDSIRRAYFFKWLGSTTT